MAQPINGVQVTRIINGSSTFEYMPGDTFTVELDYQVTGVQYLATISETLDDGLAIVNSSNAYVYDPVSKTYRWNVTSPVSGLSDGKILYEVQVSSDANIGDTPHIGGNVAWFSTLDHIKTAVPDGTTGTGAVTITVSSTESNGPCIWISNPVEMTGDGDGHIEPGEWASFHFVITDNSVITERSFEVNGIQLPESNITYVSDTPTRIEGDAHIQASRYQSPITFRITSRDYDVHYSQLSIDTYVPHYDITAWATTNWYGMNAYGGFVEPSSAPWTGNWVLLSGGNNIRIPETEITYNGPPTINGVFSGTLSAVPIVGGVLAGIFPGTTVQMMNITPRASVIIPSLTDPQNGQYKTYPIFIEGSQNNVNAHFAGQEELANTELHVMLLNLTSISANIDLTNPSTIVNSLNGLTFEELQSSEMNSTDIKTDNSCHFYVNSTNFPEMGDMKQGDYALMVWDYNLPNTPTLVGCTPIIVAKSPMDTVIQDATPKPGDSITFTESQPNALPGNNYMYVVAMIPEANYTANVDVNTEGTVDGTIVTFQGLSLNEKVTIYTDGTSDGTTFYLHGMSGDHTLTKDNLKDTDFMEQLAKDELAKSDIAFAVKNTTATMGVDIEVPTTDTMPIGKYIVLSAAVDRNTGLISAINQTSIDLGATWTFKLVKGWNLISIPLTLSDNSVDAFFPSTVKANLTDMWYYDSGNWIYYSGTRGYSPKYAHLTTLTPGKGYWVKLNSDATFTVTGTVVSGLPTASAGWTMFGVKGLNSINVITAYPNNKDMWTYANGQWYYYSGSRGYSPKYPHINSLEPGIGYWVHI